MRYLEEPSSMQRYAECVNTVLWKICSMLRHESSTLLRLSPEHYMIIFDRPLLIEFMSSPLVFNGLLVD